MTNIYDVTNTMNNLNVNYSYPTNRPRRKRSETKLCCDAHQWVGTWTEYRYYNGCPLCKLAMSDETVRYNLKIVTIQMCQVMI